MKKIIWLLLIMALGSLACSYAEVFLSKRLAMVVAMIAGSLAGVVGTCIGKRDSPMTDRS